MFVSLSDKNIKIEKMMSFGRWKGCFLEAAGSTFVIGLFELIKEEEIILKHEYNLKIIRVKKNN